MSALERSAVLEASSRALRSAFDALRSPHSRWSVPAFGAIAAAALASLWQAMSPPTYTATARILVDPAAAGASEAAAEWIATQVEIIRSGKVAHRVAADPGVKLDSPGHSSPDRDEAADTLLERVAVEPSSGGGVIAVRYAAADPAVAAQVADAFVAAYDRVSQEFQSATAAVIKERALARLSSLRVDLEQAQLRFEAADRAGMQGEVARLAQAVRVAGLASAVDWSGLPGEPKNKQGSASLLANPDRPALDGATFERATPPGALEEVRSDVDRARQAFDAAQARFARFESDRILARPAMTVLNPARESVRGPASERAETIGLAALAGLIAAWVLRATTRRIDRRVSDARDLARFSGLAVFGVLHNVDTRTRRAVRLSTRPALVADASVVPALP